MVDMQLSPAPGVAKHPSLALVNSEGPLPGGKRFDELSTPESATAWLIDRELVVAEARLYEHCQGRLTSLRTAVEDLMAAQVHHRVPSDSSVQALNAALTNASGALLLGFDDSTGFIRSAVHPATQVVERAMAIIADDAAALLTGEQASMLAICEAESCGRFFLRTHGRRQWCSTRCGDRMRAARAYARKRDKTNHQLTGTQ